ncbi:hypothetical protein GW15_0219955 [Xanthomonas axonopodis pv. vasculorum]|uniref:BFD-like [2Fe-2S]-binding domain-containing protein n=1 Tax=Xanthomonas axonopodis pv. vasculorum TaxID=325777 RepID=A0A098PV52_9XANT|nr:hypothetical protein GW15_0219955 [Xanthomonas axonopodis pv. vasculorum]
MTGKPWRGAWLSVFAHTHNAPSDTIVCTCMHVSAAAIHAAIDDGTDVAQLKQRLGCGTICGSCMPQLTRLCRQPRLA